MTLGVIGVVSAMTVPTLMQHHQKKTYVTQLHKIYNEILQAAYQYQNDNNAVNLKEAGLTTQEAIYTFFKSYFKLVKECENYTDCIASEYRKLNGSNVVAWDNTTKVFVLPNGAVIRPLLALDNDKLINIIVDINGAKGPNIQGRDLFLLCLYSNIILDDDASSAPMSEEARENLYNSQCLSNSTAAGGCFGKILNDGWEMNY